MLFDAAEQGSAFGIQGFQPGVLAPQLLGFSLDLLAVALDLLRSLFDPLHPLLVPQLELFVLHPALLIAGIPTPVEHRQKLSPPSQR